jgi:hypothetical protein
MAYNQILKDSVVIGRSQSNSIVEDTYLRNLPPAQKRWRQQSGVIFYDGPMELDGVHFVNFSTAPTTDVDGFDVTRIPMIAIGGSESFVNLTRRLSFSNQPYYRLRVPTVQITSPGGWVDLRYSFALRDRDGTLVNNTTQNQLLLGNVNYLTHTGCVTNTSPSLEGVQVCPSSSQVADLQFSVGVANYEQNIPFVVRRSDGPVSLEKADWNLLDKVKDPSTQFMQRKVHTLVSPANITFDVLLRDAPPSTLWRTNPVSLYASFENQGQATPIVRFMNLGSGCRLNGATSVTSIAALSAATTSAYYTNGNDFYVRLVAQGIQGKVNLTGGYASSRESQSGSYAWSCDNGVTSKIMGYVEGTRVENSKLKIRGWACDYGQATTIPVYMYVRQTASSSPVNTNLSLLANLTSEAGVNVLCADPSMTGHRFDFEIPDATINQYPNWLIYLHGGAPDPTRGQLSGTNYPLTK